MKARVRLSVDELNRVSEYAIDCRRYRNNKPNLFEVPGHNVTTKEFIGRVGEYAVAVYLGVDYGFRVFGDLDGDVAGYQVRTRSKHYYDLPTYPHDPDGIYILATYDQNDRGGLVLLHGWATLAETLIPGRWASYLPHPCYLTSQDQLHPMSTLPKVIHD